MGRLATSTLPSGMPSEEGPQRSRAGDKIRNDPHAGGFATAPLPFGRSPPLETRRQNLAVSGVPNALQRGTKSERAHKWADRLHHPCRVGGAQRFTPGDKITKGPQVG